MRKNKEKILEVIRYFIVGILTTVVSLITYYGLTSTVLNPNNALSLQIANIISWVISVIFAYITNRVFVFKSQNKNKLKEFTSFVSSRVITLLMDMGIMFLGVTIFAINDKFIKLVSQGIVIVANYIFSKLFVFNNKEKKKRNYGVLKERILKSSIVLLVFLELILFLWPSELLNYICYGFFVFSFLFMIVSLCFQKKSRLLIGSVLFYLLIQHFYLYCQNLLTISESSLLIQIFLFPISFLYFYYNPLKDANAFMAKIFYLLLFLFFLPIFSSTNMSESFFSFKNSITVQFIAFLPMIFSTLVNHHNFIAITLGFFLIFLLIFLWESFPLALVILFCTLLFLFQIRKKFHSEKIIFIPLLLLSFGVVIYLGIPFLKTYQNSALKTVLFDDRLSILEENKEKFNGSNIEEKLFGIGTISEIGVRKIKIDLADIFYHIGIVGFSSYLLFAAYTLWIVRMSSLKKIGFCFVLVSSFFLGNVFVNGFTIILISMLALKEEEKKKKILLVSNMYPSKRFKHYGSFVKNTKEILEDLSFDIDLVVKKKQTSFVGKLGGYSIMYLKGIYLSIFHSYDYIYVHFVSLSTFCVLLGKMTSRKTVLVLNTHGNDIVPDYRFEEKNVERSKKCLKYGDKIVAPSIYFKDVLIKEYSILEEKIFVYPSGGVDLDLFFPKEKQECKKELGLQESIRYYGFVSRIEKDKGWDTLLNALNKLNKEKLLKNIKVLVIGSGSEQSEFDILVRQYKLQDVIIQKEFVYQKDLVNYYNAFDLFLYPTKRKSESLGLVGLEAMACKTFVIGCNLYGPREYLKDKENSFTFRDEATLVKKIKEFQKLDRKEIKKIQEKALEEAKKYEKEKNTSLLKEVFS